MSGNNFSTHSLAALLGKEDSLLSILGANLREVNKGNKVSPKFFMTCVQPLINSYLCMDKIGTRPRRALIQAYFEEDILNEL